MSDLPNENELKSQYAKLSDFQLKQEFQKIASIPDARTNIEALTKVSVMIPEFEKRGIAVPTPARQGRAADAQQYQEVYHQEESSGPSIATAGIGIILMIGSVVLSMNSGRIFYGAFLVGFVMFIKSFF